MDSMKLTRIIPLLAATSIISAALFAFISPIVAVDCGVNASHIVIDIGEVVDPSAENVAMEQSSTGSYIQVLKPPLGPCDQDAQSPHMHGAHSHMMLIPNPTPSHLGSLSLIPPPPSLHLTNSNLLPPLKPPRITA